MKQKAVFNWSGGKDSALCLYKILNDSNFDVKYLMTNISKQHQRITLHGVRTELLEAQAQSLDIELIKVQLSEMPTLENYNNVMKNELLNLKAKGITASIYGDIYLEDLRKYREKKLSELQFEGIFPLWNIPSNKIIQEFIELGFKTIVTCVNEKYLDKSFVGRIINEEFLRDLPENVDPCGEKGEFHTFVFDGPIFKQPISFKIGEIVYKKYETKTSNTSFDTGFWFCDLIPTKTINVE